MVRRALILAVVSCLTPAAAWAQTSFAVRDTVTVRKAPVTSSPVVGTAERGTALELIRDVGDWVQVSWPQSPDRVGYVRVKLGSSLLPAFEGMPAIRSGQPSSTVRAAAPLAASPAVEQAPASRPGPVDPDLRGRNAVAYELPVHTVGLGVRMEPTLKAVGVSARLWSASRFGAQVELGRSSLGSDLVPARLTSFQFSPAAMYALPDVVGGSVWVRPYVGSGLDVTRATFRSIPPGTTMQETRFGMKVFGGGEMTFPGAPQVAVGADLGYHWLDSPFGGFELGGLRANLSAHWYIR